MNDAKTALGQKILATKVWTCAACLGQMSMTAETTTKAS